MKLSTDTWHYRNWQIWLDRSGSKRASKYKKKYYGSLSDHDMKDVRNYSPDMLHGLIIEDEISQNGYKRFKLYYPPEQQPNLCIYFWAATVRGPYRRVLRWFSKHFVTACIIITTAFIVAAGTFANLVDPNITWWHPYAIVAGAMAAVVVLLGLVWGLLFAWFEHIWPWVKSKAIPEQADSEKGPNILVEHIKAKKSKVCPILEFED